MAVEGVAQRRIGSGRTRLSGSWPVVRLWELEAEDLFTLGDVGLVPWIPLTQSVQPPEQLLIRCRDRIAEVQEIKDRAGLLAVTQILVGLAYPNHRFFDLFGGAKVMIDSPALDEVKQILREQYGAEARLDECKKMQSSCSKCGSALFRPRCSPN